MDSDLDSLLNSVTYKSKDKTKLIIPEEKPGQNSRELNPYWKNGGSGLPTPSTSNQGKTAAAGDGGLSWWKKALQRCKETAVEEGTSLEEVAAGRYGSLSFLQNKIKEAELYLASTGRSSSSSSDKRRGRESFKGKSFTRPNDSDYYSGRKREHERRRDIDYRRRDMDDRERDRDDRRIDVDDRRSDKRCSERDQFYRNDCENRRDEPYKVKSNPLPTPSNFGANPRYSRNATETPDEQMVQKPSKQLSAEEKNKLSAKLLRAEMMGDKDLVNQLKAMMDGSGESSYCGNKREARKRNDDEDEEEEILVLQNQKGGVVPFQDRKPTIEPQGRNKKQKLETHQDGQRVRYFHDDDQKSLETLVREEKLSRGSNDLDTINRMAGRATRALYEDETIDDEMLRNETTNKPAKTFSKQKQLAIIEQKKMSSKIADCAFCFENIQKHLVVSMGTKTLLCMPRNRSMVEGHCLIVTLQHVIQSTACDEDILEEINTYKKSLVRMFEENDEDVIFLETCKNLKSYPHLVIECIPVPREIGEVAPICFQKAINECGPEWSNNKKLVTIRGGVKRSIPAGFPYFHVGFGTDDGYGHVIEDEESFPWYFGREVVGGLLDLETTLWRKPRFDDFEEQRKKTVEFTKSFKPFDPLC